MNKKSIENPVNEKVKKTPWYWRGHTFRQSVNSIRRKSLNLNPLGRRNKGGLKYGEEIEIEINYMGRTSNEVQQVASDEVACDWMVKGLCPRGRWKVSRRRTFFDHDIE